ncbi:2,3-bisphosphoglycerate-independent phosphoglycerate mutase [Proteiniclasticum sp. BAD-10]|uniref:2,3-bisphosphoglycerate-independent phosphoglycerate mutase n=1 Tax=Proteiniclasticum sediminis TaxID=2804028 RepID=A0A941CP20_9CLOT|nr:2,3-bisphosphoglycerate-independent phosphoglycerate mutase [Proteiniclasticum sediminis]MBR0576142.1 2,3-bisphosphoglycerate-independent phosphoglycerate mutase [Proteiniclasticum sediminis]
MKKPVMLMILDGFGLTDNPLGNAVMAAHKPNYDYYWGNYPHTTIAASGMAVGLPEGQMGNSEVGHMNIGAGRVIFQELTRITHEIETGDFFNNEKLILAVDHARENGTDLHLMGLVSDGGVHSHIEHIKALFKLAKDRGLDRVYLHAFMDGRDVSPTSGINFLDDLERYFAEIGVGKIATVSGRYYAMDRDNRWDRVKKAYDALVYGTGEFFPTAHDCMSNSYAQEVTDEFIVPAVIGAPGAPAATVKNGDSVIFFNFRPDRGREMTRALNDKVFHGFERENLDLTYVTMTQYDKTLENVHVAFTPTNFNNTLGKYIADKGIKQLRIAETEKYAHVTFFFNGGVEIPNEGEDRILVSSPKVATYDLKPEMSAEGVTDKVIEAMDKEDYGLVILNYANPDMVGHTGMMKAVVEALEDIDTYMKRVIDKVLEKDGTVFITADHGNAEQLIDYVTGGPMTAHTTNPVPLIYVTNQPTKVLKDGGRLADLAPTMLEEMGLEIPAEMTGNSLLV